jgi:hypothetical protein
MTSQCLTRNAETGNTPLCEPAWKTDQAGRRRVFAAAGAACYFERDSTYIRVQFTNSQARCH